MRPLKPFTDIKRSIRIWDIATLWAIAIGSVFFLCFGYSALAYDDGVDGPYTDHGDGTVSDLGTNLMWQQSDDELEHVWDDAVTYCEELTLAGYDDWQLPGGGIGSGRELESLIDKGYSPSINPLYFPDTKNSGYWSGSTFETKTDHAWYVYFDDGRVYYDDKYFGHYVRCVRSFTPSPPSELIFLLTAEIGNGYVPFTGFFECVIESGNSPYDYFWDFGDGDARDGVQNENHVFTEPGVYNVVCTVTDARGQVAEDTVAFEAKEKEPLLTVYQESLGKLSTESLYCGNIAGGGIACPDDCSQYYPDESEVILSATPNECYWLDSWSGCDSVQGGKCYVHMDDDKTVTAKFGRISNTAITLENGDRFSTTLNDAEDQDFYSITIPHSGTFIVYTTGDADTKGEILDSDCNYSVLASDDNGGDGGNFRIIHVIDSPGQYYVSVTPGNAEEKVLGAYTLHVAHKLTSTFWRQGNPYTIFFDPAQDNVCTTDVLDQNERPEYVVGCSAIAIGQLINYYFQEGRRPGWLETIEYDERAVFPRFTDTNDHTESVCQRDGVEGCHCDSFETSPLYVDSIDNSFSDNARALREFLWRVAIGLDADFEVNEGTGVGALYDHEPDPDVYDGRDKHLTLMRDRFNFNPNMTHSDRLDNLAAEEDYIVSSIDSGHPVLVSTWGNIIGCPEQCRATLTNEVELEACLKECNAGHDVLIDAYRYEDDHNLKLLINFGWGNTSDTNITWYDAADSFTDAAEYIRWERFYIYKNTVPNSNTATSNHNELYLPCLDLGEMDCWVKFILLIDDDSLKFRVESYGTAQIHSNCATYDMTNSTIHIPDVSVDGTRLWLDLKLRDDGLFDLINFGEVNSL